MRSANTVILLAIALTVVSLAGCRSRGWHYQTADQIADCMISEKSFAIPEGIPANFSLVPPPESRLATDGYLACPTLPQNLVELYAYDLPLRRPLLESEQDDANEASEDIEIVGTPIPLAAWQSLPQSCLKRMLDFASIQREAEFTKERLDADPLVSGSAESAPKLSLRDIIDLGLLNSRDYQTQKENLYLVSLRLAQERFAYTTKFSANGNNSAFSLANLRNGGTTVERLGLPSNLTIDRALITGGDLFASFANNILLTFDGPSGFTSDVSSSLLIDFVQPLIQTDIQFESLTQAERDLVYAARDFARFRKGFFVDFAAQYYDLIASFRQIEIDSQNYFSLVRAFNQAEAEYTAGIVPRFQVDQVEQSLLNGRGRLIGTCNSVEQALDRLKLVLGIPTETPINVDLEELNELTRLDQLSVSADSTSRVLKRLRAALERPDRSELASTAAVLLDRLIESLELKAEQQAGDDALDEYRALRAQFLIDYERLNSDRILFELEQEIGSESPSLPVIFQRSIAYCNGLLLLAEQQLQYAALTDEEAIAAAAELEKKAAISADADDVLQAEEETADTDGRADASTSDDDGDDASDQVTASKFVRYRQRVQKEAANVELLRDKLRQLIENEQIGQLPELIEESNTIQKQLGQFVRELDKTYKIEFSQSAAEDLSRIQAAVNRLIRIVTEQNQNAGLGLKPIDIDMDDAMITAIVLRYELMNQRGVVADDWRGIKLAADELKYALTLRASHRIDTPPGANQPFNFDLDNSSTSLGLSFDSPLNRFSQRNSFRGSLIAYQRSLRNLKLLEDNIKFSVRNDLRNLTLDREQYLIAVASAALAYERVVSTSLEFRLGTGGVSARDFLEAQTAYIDALSNVASRHIRYLVDRTQLFFDLELLMVDDDGFWEDIRNEELQPEPAFSIPVWGTPVFGDLPNVRYSSTVRQILQPVIAGLATPLPGTEGALNSGGNATDPSQLPTPAAAEQVVEPPARAMDQINAPPEPLAEIPTELPFESPVVLNEEPSQYLLVNPNR